VTRPVSTRDLRATERTFVEAMTSLGFGRFEYLRIERGELILDPWPGVVRDVKFGSQDPGTERTFPADFDLKPQVAELFEYIRDVDAGEIRCLEVKNGLPFSMEIELPGRRRNG
jgi:hypothetical protein